MSEKNLIGVFKDEFTLVKAMEELKEKGLPIKEVFTPYPVHEVIHLMGKKSRLQIAGYFYGLFGALAVLAFLYWTSVIDWPITYGGKPFNSFPSFLLITIVLTIFIVTIASLATFSARAKLWPGKKHKIYDYRASDDKFLIVFDKDEVKDEISRVSSILNQHGASEILDKDENQRDNDEK